MVCYECKNRIIQLFRFEVSRTSLQVLSKEEVEMMEELDRSPNNPNSKIFKLLAKKYLIYVHEDSIFFLLPTSF